MDIEKTREILKTKRAAVVGCGGLGGYVTECLCRAGIGRLTVMDGDSFTSGNLNRQLYATIPLLGKNKAVAAAERAALISDTAVEAVDKNFSVQTAHLLEGADVIVDCVDNVETRLLLEKFASSAQIPMVHGAINGTQAQVTVVMPDSGALAALYKKGAPEVRPTVCPLPMLAGAAEAAEVIKILTGWGEPLIGKLLIIDLTCNDCRVLEI